MFGSSMLDIAIGIVFVFLLLSIFSTAINEIILSFFNLRGRFLLNGIRSLLNEDSETSALHLVTRIYNHGQVCGLYKGDFDPSRLKQIKPHLPSYIPSRNFAVALLDSAEQYFVNQDKDHIAALTRELVQAEKDAASAATAAAEAPGEQCAATALTSAANKKAKIEQAIIDTNTSLKTHMAALQTAAANALNATKAANLRQMTLAANPSAPGMVVTVPNILAITDSVRKGAEALALNHQTEKVGKPLLSMIAMAGDDANKLQKAVEDWYNSAMDRTSGWYKYRTQTVLFAIGLVMAIVINADTIGIVRQLSRDSTLRQSIVAAAQHPPTPQAAGNQTPTPESTPDQTFKAKVDAADTAFDHIHTLGLPLGWPDGLPRLVNVLHHPGTKANWIALRKSMFSSPSAERLVGWLLTSIAISLGAPFWFDALNKIMVVRSTVKPQEKSQDEPSKS
jgi:hypothetical protein